jgi:hypothetical protein
VEPIEINEDTSNTAPSREVVLLAVNAVGSSRITAVFCNGCIKKGFLVLTNYNLTMFSEDFQNKKIFPLDKVLHISTKTGLGSFQLLLSLGNRQKTIIYFAKKDREVVEQELAPILNAIIQGRLSTPLGVPEDLSNIQTELQSQCIKLMDATKTPATKDTKENSEAHTSQPNNRHLKIAGMALACLIAFLAPFFFGHLEKLYAIQDMAQMTGWRWTGQPSPPPTDTGFDSTKNVARLEESLSTLRNDLSKIARSRKIDERAVAIHAKQERKQLKSAITSLQTELNRAKLQKNQGVQKAIVASNKKLGNINKTIADLQTRLETSEAEKRDREEQSLAINNAKISTIEKNISSMKDELKSSLTKKDAAAKTAISNSYKEIVMVKNSVSMLRNELKTAISDTVKQPQKPVENQKWYQGGSLQKSTNAQWSQSNNKERLATSAGWIINKVKLTQRQDLRQKTQLLQNCIDRMVAEGNRFAGAMDMASHCIDSLKFPRKKHSGKHQKGLKTWYDGGTLQTASRSEWGKAHKDNRLATAASWVIQEVKLSAISDLEKKAKSLNSCISTKSKLTKNRNRSAEQLANECIAHLQFTLKNG